MLQSAVATPALMLSAVQSLVPKETDAKETGGGTTIDASGLEDLYTVVAAVLRANSRSLVLAEDSTPADSCILPAASVVLRFFSKFASSVVATCCSYASQSPLRAGVAAARVLSLMRGGAVTLMDGAEGFLVGARAGTRSKAGTELPFDALRGGAAVPAILLHQILGLCDAAVAVYADMRAGMLNQGLLPVLDMLQERLSRVKHAAGALSFDFVDDAKRAIRHSRKMLARSRELALVLMIGTAPIRRSRVIPPVLHALQSPLLFGGLLHDEEQDKLTHNLRTTLDTQVSAGRSELDSSISAALADPARAADSVEPLPE